MKTTKILKIKTDYYKFSRTELVFDVSNMYYLNDVYHKLLSLKVMPTSIVSVESNVSNDYLTSKLYITAEFIISFYNYYKRNKKKYAGEQKNDK